MQIQIYVNKPTKVRSNGKSYNWDYNRRYSYHYCQEYGHVPKNCIRTHFKGNYQRWLSQIAHFRCLKTSHISKYCLTMSKALSCDFDKGKGKAYVEHIIDEMKKTWENKNGCNTSNRVGITSPNRSSGLTSSN